MNVTPNPIVVPMTVSVSAESVPLLISVNAEQVNFEVGYDIRPGGGGEFPWYDGAYEVTPRLTEQKLETYHRIMRDDVTVHEIPITSTSNPEGGRTVLIG